MAQLIMRWQNDHTAAEAPVLASQITLTTFSQLPQALTVWQDIMRYLAKNGDLDTGGDYYRKNMLEYPNYREEMCYFLLVDGRPAATASVLCDHKTKQGYLHMVACKPEFRGMGLGTLLNRVAVYTLKQEQMESAYLTTDDWRIPAIKSYLRAGFLPDLDSEPDFRQRWSAINELLEEKK